MIYAHCGRSRKQYWFQKYVCGFQTLREYLVVEPLCHSDPVDSFISNLRKQNLGEKKNSLSESFE